ncbi:hypothetical protein DICPUDRAFT_43649 [Dictyostelium purpureum]|uniref:Uncharacterized protein n=1 Tax=Dictyostelium purpureum TaxID=5786 RepID=F1A4J0_DICPU|nr:uncharacterized protein DICPUDRAFT_43649 [Dictyostelium purpureum]EGC28888.1 hypothetical protein DICPUDRAFT_43649 [Dictyostelium purpureum]|eukprot:XP_003294580.1 hypothetical protein DICPUDRAFT_43649 [Dictyostelium purpureum]
METFNKQFEDNDVQESEWIETLKQFNKENADKRIFTDRVSAETKFKFTNNLFFYLKTEFNPSVSNKPSDESKTQVLTALRISLRELLEEEKDIIRKELYLFIKLGNIGEEEKTNMYSNSVREEALKCIVNCISRDPSIQKIFLEDLKGPYLLTKEVKNHSKETPDSVLDVIYKILVHCCSKPEVKAKLRPEGLLEYVTEALITRVADTQKYESSPELVSDLCRLLFTLTIHLGPLEGGKPTPANHLEIEGFRKLLPTFKRIMVTNTPETTHPFFAVKTALLSALINTPRDLYDELIDEIGLHIFQDIFKKQLYLLDSPETAAQFLPILMLLTSTAENVPSTRDELKAMTFPYDLIKDSDEPLSVGIEPPEEVKTTGVSSKLIPFMTGNDIGLKHFVSEYFFMICDEDANEVCRLTGFGNAAGLLVTRGLMSLGGGGK